MNLTNPLIYKADSYVQKLKSMKYKIDKLQKFGTLKYRDASVDYVLNTF